jgi:hypothetical protein
MVLTSTPTSQLPTPKNLDIPGSLDEVLRDFGPILAIKLYRLNRGSGPDVPYIPCLDHEAMLHERIPPHAAAYVQEASSGDLHEVVIFPATKRLQIDTVSTWGEHSAESRERLAALIRSRLPQYRLQIRGPSWWRGERRVANACLAQVSLRDVLLGTDTASIRAGIERLQAVGGLMEKQSRVSSWGVRTLTGPLLAAAGVITFLVLGRFESTFGATAVTALRYGIVGALGAVFVYYGLKAVQLTEMSNRVWKRTAEYNLILAERKRLGR